MAITTLGAIALGAGAIGSAALGSSAASKAASASQAAADRSAQVQQDIYNQNKGILSPYVNQGIAPNTAINALLGLSGGDRDWTRYLSDNPDVANGYAGVDHTAFATPQDYARWHYDNYGKAEGRAQPGSQQEAAFDAFRNSTGYDFRFNEGMRALNSGFAGAGTINSGAARKSAINYGQGQATQEFGNYLNALGSQQGIGLSAGSALAGVGANYANALGSIYTQNGENQANAALAKANSITGAIGGGLSLGARYGLFGGG